MAIFPVSAKAVTIYNNTFGYSSHTYYTNGVSKPRTTNHLATWSIDNSSSLSNKVFCVEPGKTFQDNTSQSGYSSTTSTPSGSWASGISSSASDIEKVLSCYTSSNYSITAAQGIVWELISGERDEINTSEILNGDFTPYMSNGKVYSKTTLYDIYFKSGKTMESQYNAILRCAARFNVTPSFAKSTDSSAKSNALQLTSYNDETQTFSRTFKHSASYSNDSTLLRYYEVSSSDSGVKVSKTSDNKGITVTTTKEIANKSDAIRITLKYTYKDDGKEELNNFGPLTYYVKSGYQSLVKGSTTKTVYLYVYTGERPTYQLRVRKVDEDGNPMSGVTFNVYSDSALTKKVGTTTASDSDGYAYLKGIEKIGKYYVQESSTPDGYVTNKEVKTVEVTGTHKEGTSNYATASSSFVNKYMHLALLKKTIDSEGNVVSINDYTGSNCTGDYKGPVFTITKDGNDLYVIENSAGNYTISSSSNSSATTEIKTCNGEFNIEKIESGTYEITEIEAPDGYTLPENPTQTVTVTKGTLETGIAMYNGVTGVIFNKISENGELLDGGTYALQQRVNGVYRDMLLKQEEGVKYTYVEGLTESDDGATYLLSTTNGTINVTNLPPGEYRFVEKQAPSGYDIIKDKDSNATFTISDKGIFGDDGTPVTDYYQVRLVNQETKVDGSYDEAELIVTIITGRKVANYTLIIAGLAVLLTLLIILRKKFKK